MDAGRQLSFAPSFITFLGSNSKDASPRLVLLFRLIVQPEKGAKNDSEFYDVLNRIIGFTEYLMNWVILQMWSAREMLSYDTCNEAVLVPGIISEGARPARELREIDP